MNFFKNSCTYSFGLMLAIAGMLLSIVPAGAPPQKQLPAVSQADPGTPASATSSQTPSRTREQAGAAYGKLRMSFVANQGQTDGSVNFTARGAGYSLFLKPTEAVFAMSRKKDTAERGVNEQPWQMGQPNSDMTKTETAVLRMKLVGVDADSPSEGLEKQEGKVNYFIGNDESKWQTNISTFAKVKYQDVYAGIDMIYYGNQQQLEYDFIVAPNADYKQIKLNFDGAKRVEIEKTTGDLLLHMRLGTMRQHQPLVYQELGGERQEIAGRYVRRGKQIGFEVGKYDATLPLVIDPTLVYSTFIGGSSEDRGNSIAVDSTGNTYIIGTTLSPDFPTTVGAFDRTFHVDSSNQGAHVFVTKLNASGSALIYSTFIGGSGGEAGNGIAIDSTGNAYLTGSTSSLDYPTTAGAFNGTKGGNGSTNNVFVTKLNASGSALIYSTYIAALGNDVATAIAIDSTGNAYLTGEAGGFAPIYPTTPGAFQTTHGGGVWDVFVTKLNASGSALIYSTLIGGGGSDVANGIAIDSTGNAYVTGQTGGFAPLYPTTVGAFQRTINSSSNVFVTKLNASGSALIYSTFISGSGGESGTGIAIDSTGNAYLTGYTLSTDYPTTAGAFDRTFHGQNDVFVTKLNAGGSALIYSTLIGANQNDIGNGIAIDSTGNAYVTGQTTSPLYPTTPGAFQTTLSGFSDVFLTKLNASGSALIYSTFIGGSSDDMGNGIAIDSTGNAYVTGITVSPNYPTTAGAFDTTFGGGGDVFVTKIDTTLPPTPTTIQFSSGSYSVGEGDGHVNITLTRSGDTTSSASVNYATSDSAGLTNCNVFNGIASARCDYENTQGTMSFAAGETSKSFSIAIVDDSYAEGSETFAISLNSPSGATLGTQSTTTVMIVDNETSTGPNLIDNTNFFVRQHYLDFLGREPDPMGAQWVSLINNCPQGDTSCDRVHVSGIFFQSEEFQTRGYFVYRFYPVSFGRKPDYAEFVVDLARVSGFLDATQLEAAKVAFITDFMARPAFVGAYNFPNTPTGNQQYVDALLNTAAVTLPAATRQTLIDGLNNSTMTRAQVLRQIVESTEVSTKYNHQAFAVMEYFGYLRRQPDALYLNWIQVLDANPADSRHMVEGFVNSREYRQRFGP